MAEDKIRKLEQLRKKSIQVEGKLAAVLQKKKISQHEYEEQLLHVHDHKTREQYYKDLDAAIVRNTPRRTSSSHRAPSLAVLSALSFFIIAMLLYGFIAYTTITGHTTIDKGQTHHLPLNITFAENSTYATNLSNITSLRISGTITGNGSVSILVPQGDKQLIVLHSAARERKNFITGKTIDNVTAENVTNLPAPDRIDENSSQAENVTAVENSSMPESTPETITTSAEQNLSEPVTPETVSVDGAVNQSILEPEAANITEEELPDITENNENSYAFNLICIDTCSTFIEEATLIIEVDNAAVTITNITYTKRDHAPDEIPLVENSANDTEITNESQLVQNETPSRPSLQSMLSRSAIVINQPVKWTQDITTAENVSGIEIPVPVVAFNITAKKITGGEELTIAKDNISIPSHEKNALTGNVIVPLHTTSEIPAELATNETVNVTILETADHVRVEYYTQGPITEETEFSSGKKRIHVFSNIHYENIFSYTSIPDVPQERISFYWIDDGIRKKVTNVSYYDENNNGLVDYISWIVPHLSNETYEVSITILNVQSYPYVGGTWTVLINTSGEANLTISAVEDTSYGSYPDDLTPLQLICSGSSIPFIWTGKDVTVENYRCDSTASWTVHVHTAGRHVQQFTFGNITAFAYNDASQASMNGSRIQPSPLANDTDNLFGYCNGTTNSTTEPKLIYNYSWYKDDVLNVSGTVFKAETITTEYLHSCGIRANDSRVLCWGDNYNGKLGNGSEVDSYNPILTSDDSKYIHVSVGWLHSCGIRANDSRVLCWGSNDDGQLGDGTTTRRLNPTLINDSNAYVQISAEGQYHTCGLRNDSRVLCWGRNANGQLGNGSTGSSVLNPMLINDSAEYRSINAGYFHSCGIRANDSRVLCWGRNDFGAVGDGTNIDRPNPTLINDTAEYISISASYDYTSGIRVNDSRVMFWGWNTNGQAGDGTSGNSKLNPIQTSDDSEYASIDAGNAHVCGIRANDSHVLCWGRNDYGQAGNGSAGANILTPLAINDTSNYYLVETGNVQTCGIRANDSHVLCWGYNNNGQLGDGTQINRNVSTPINDTASYFPGFPSDKETCINVLGSYLTTPGEEWIFSCMASDAYSQSPDWLNSTITTIIDETVPAVTLDKNASQIEYGTGSIHINWTVTDDQGVSNVIFNVTFPNGTLLYSATAINGSVNLTSTANLSTPGNYTITLWANNTYNGTNSATAWFTVNDTTAPTVHLVSPANTTNTSNSSQTFTCNITDNYEAVNLTLHIWNASDSPLTSNTTNISGTSNSTAWTYTFPTGGVYYWNCQGGDANNAAWSNEGNYTINFSTILVENARIDPTPLANYTDNLFGYCNATHPDGEKIMYNYTWYRNDVLNVSGTLFKADTLRTGDLYTCGIRANDSRVLCWGYNYDGQLGNGTKGGSQPNPTLTSNDSAYSSISAGSSHICAIRTNDSRVLCWGDNIVGNLGNGGTTDSPDPTPINDSAAYNSISAGGSYTCAIRANDHRVVCWGSNTYGQLGNGTTTQRNNPTPINDTAAYTTITTGTYHTCGIRANDSQVQCWGNNENGELGNGTGGGYQPNPQPINDITPYASIKAGDDYTCGIRANDSRVVCWGSNSVGQLGKGTPGEDRPNPTPINDTAAYTTITTGTYHTCGIRANDSRVLCWGSNTYGQLGDGTTTPHYNPATINDTTQYTSTDTGTHYTCGIRANDSQVMCWGRNSYGQLGDGTTTPHYNPATINSTSSFFPGWPSGQEQLISVLGSAFTAFGENWTLSCMATNITTDSAWLNSSATRIIDGIFPNVGITKNETQVEYGNSIYINWSATDSIGISDVVFNITLPNGTLLFNSSTAVSNVTLTVLNLTQLGQYNLTLWANDTSNNAASKTANFSVNDTTAPTIHLTSPANQTIASTASNNLMCNITDNYGVYNLTLYVWNSTGSQVNTPSWSWCYQESANVSPGCGGLPTGTYANTSAWSNIYNATDGDWNTYANRAGGNGYSYLYVNYSVPNGASNTSLWQVKDYENTVNLTLNNLCWNDSILQFQIRAYYNAVTDNIAYWDCWNGSAFMNLRSYINYNYIYEEAMYWNITSSYTTSLGGTSNSSSWNITFLYNGLFTWNCLGYDASNLSSWSVEGNYTISYSQPNVTSIAVLPARPRTTDNITCNATAVDSENSTLSIEWTWYNNSVQYSTGITTGVSNNTNTLIT
ncbi:MAG: hypothetical protein V1725_02400, partial [archaeon]